MKIYILHQNGEIRVTGHIDVFNKDILESDNPQYTAEEISQEDYDIINGKQENFSVEGGKIKEKTQLQKDEIQMRKDDWVKDNTLRGLQTQLKDMRIELLKINEKL